MLVRPMRRVITRFYRWYRSQVVDPVKHQEVIAAVTSEALLPRRACS